MRLWLDPIPPELHAEAVKRCEAGNALGLLCLARSVDGLSLVQCNAAELRARGIYENVLAYGFTSTRVNHHDVKRAYTSTTPLAGRSGRPGGARTRARPVA
jgi:hypothetical protein